MTRLTAWRKRMRDAQRDAGFTVIEVLVSFVIFAIVATSASYGLVQAIDASHSSQQRVDAANVAQAAIADAIIRANDYPPAQGVTQPAGVLNEDFTVTQTVVWDDPGDCNAGTMFWVHIVVRQKQTNQFLARSDARVACPRV